MAINMDELTKEQAMKVMKCKTADELMALAEAEGVAITKEEAEAYLAEMADVELDGKELRSVAGGVCWQDCVGQYCDDGCSFYCPLW